MLTKISEIVVSDIIDYLRISETSEKEEKYLKTILNVSKEYIRKYTGYDKIEDLDKYPDLVIVVFLCYVKVCMMIELTTLITQMLIKLCNQYSICIQGIYCYD